MPIRQSFMTVSPAHGNSFTNIWQWFHQHLAIISQQSATAVPAYGVNWVPPPPPPLPLLKLVRRTAQYSVSRLPTFATIKGFLPSWFFPLTLQNARNVDTSATMRRISSANAQSSRYRRKKRIGHTKVRANVAAYMPRALPCWWMPAFWYFDDGSTLMNGKDWPHKGERQCGSVYA